MNREQAYLLANQVNGELWQNAAAQTLSDIIEEAASNGTYSVEVELKDLIIGAENLREVREMLIAIDDYIEDCEFDSKVTINGTLLISW